VATAAHNRQSPAEQASGLWDGPSVELDPADGVMADGKRDIALCTPSLSLAPQERAAMAREQGWHELARSFLVAPVAPAPHPVLVVAPRSREGRRTRRAQSRARPSEDPSEPEPPGRPQTAVDGRAA